MGRINGVVLSQSSIVTVPGGDVKKLLRADECAYQGFGEAYLVTINAGVIKDWRLHERMTATLFLLSGIVRLVLFDPRKDSITHKKFQEILLSRSNQLRVTVSPGIWFAFRSESKADSLLLNISNILHDDNEVMRAQKNQISYKWPKIDLK
jgi:dTDP-4-dehydrorhamnose 3,5-epimerase